MRTSSGTVSGVFSIGTLHIVQILSRIGLLKPPLGSRTSHMGDASSSKAGEERRYSVVAALGKVSGPMSSRMRVELCKAALLIAGLQSFQ